MVKACLNRIAVAVPDHGLRDDFIDHAPLLLKEERGGATVPGIGFHAGAAAAIDPGPAVENMRFHTGGNNG